MPEMEALKRAGEDAREGKSPSTQAGEFVHEEIEHIKEGKHGARSARQAIAIGLSKARRAGIKLPPPREGTAPEKTREQAIRESDQVRSKTAHRVSAHRSRAATRALQNESGDAVSHEALSRQALSGARQKGSADRKRAEQKTARARAAGQARELRMGRNGHRQHEKMGGNGQIRFHAPAAGFIS